MPELPEVETTKRGLKNLVLGEKIESAWTDWPKYFSRNSSQKTFSGFKDFVKNKEIKNVKRIGKNVLIELSKDGAILIHQKMTGHLLVGKWKEGSSFKGNKNISDKWVGESWVPDIDEDSYLWDPKNRFIRLILFLKGRNMIALSDMRRFAKILFGRKEDVLKNKDISKLGPDPTDKNFTFKDFKKLFIPKEGSRKVGKIKQVLMDQKFLVGIGNIYADEILWKSKIHPEARAEKLNEKGLEKIFKSTKEILKEAIRLKGTSTDDYRDPTGEKGGFAKKRKVYQRDGEKCTRCGAIILKIRVGNRGTHFCPKCQKLNNKDK